MIDLTELQIQIGEIDKDFTKKTRCETAKCTLKIIGILVATISFTVVGVLLQLLTALKIAPYVCYAATICITPFACKYSISLSETTTDIKVLLTLATIERVKNAVHTFFENHKEEIENDDTN